MNTVSHTAEPVFQRCRGRGCHTFWLYYLTLQKYLLYLRARNKYQEPNVKFCPMPGHWNSTATHTDPKTARFLLCFGSHWTGLSPVEAEPLHSLACLSPGKNSNRSLDDLRSSELYFTSFPRSQLFLQHLRKDALIFASALSVLPLFPLLLL